MASVKVAASVELQGKANFTRLSRLLVDKGTEALRNTLDERHPPTDLPTVLNASKTSLLNLKSKRVINDNQWYLLFPPSGSQPPDSKTFDVTLLTVLLRNLPPWLPTPATGWDTMPPDTDNSLGANITRIKLYRNQVYAHVTSTQVEKGTFDHLWQKISKALIDLNVPQNEIDDLKTCPLGPEEEIYEQSLKEWVLKEEECKNMLEGLKNVNLMQNLLMEQTADMQRLEEIIEQSHQEIKQLCTFSSSGSGLPRSTYDHEERRGSGKPITGEELLQKLAKYNFKNKIKRKVEFFHRDTRKWLLKQIDNWFEDKDDENDDDDDDDDDDDNDDDDEGIGEGKDDDDEKDDEDDDEGEDVDEDVEDDEDDDAGDDNEGEDNKKKSRILLLTAGPGFGKSVLAAKVCEIFEKKQRLAACHFCDFSDSNLKDPKMMLQSLASHMCQNIVGFKEKLLDQLKRPHQVRSLKDAFQIYLQIPLGELEIERSLIVIDGLDEIATDDKSDIVTLIADNFQDLPRCVKVLVTSLPELCLQRLDHIKVIEINVDDRKNKSDILNYLNVCLPTLAARDKMNNSTKSSYFNILPEIMKKCEGSFLYAFHVQHELRKREDLDTMTFEDIMAVLPKGMGFVYTAYFRRLEDELKAIMKRSPDLFNLLELLVAVDTKLPLNFIARAFDLPLDCRETKKVINKVNEVISCFLYVSDDLITVFHNSVYDWLLGNGYDDHEYIVKVSDGKKRLWQLCEQVFKEIKRIVCSGDELKLTNDVKHALEYGHEYLFACQIRDSFPWFVDMIIVHVILNVYPQSFEKLGDVLEKIFGSDMVFSVQLRQRMSWHLARLKYYGGVEIESMQREGYDDVCFYLEAVLDYSPKGCFTDDERKIAEVILSRSPCCVRSNSVGIKPTFKPLFTNRKLLTSDIVAVGVSSSKKLAAIALKNGTICVLSLPELIELWQYSTGYNHVSSCTFSPNDTLILYGKLETVLNIREVKEEVFFDGEIERFKSCAFSSNGKRLITNDGSGTLKLWDVVRRRLVTVLSAGAPVHYCAFSNTGLFIVLGTTHDTYCVWNSITLQRVDQRSIERSEKDGILKSKICNRCFRQERKEIIPSKELMGIAASMQVNRRFPYAMKSLLEICTSAHRKTSTGIYKGVDCIFDFDPESYFRVIENIHFTTLAIWEFNMPNLSELETVAYIAAIGDDYWLYGDKERLIVYSSVSTKENQSSMSLPTCVLWCSFSPDGTRLATCTSDGFINLWKVDTCQVYQRFRSNPERSSAACWWSDEYLFVCFVTDTIPCLSKYPVDETLRINITYRQLVPFWSVLHEFLPFSGLLEFSEGYLCFECGETEPVKVIDVTEPKKVVLPEMAPMMSIAVSPQGSFVLGANIECYLLWRKSATQPHVYEVFVRRDRPSYATCGPSNSKGSVVCCFNNDSKFALVSHFQNVVIIDVATRIAKTITLEGNNGYLIGNVFGTGTFVILLIPHRVRIFDLQSLNLLVTSVRHCAITDCIIDAKLSPKGTVLAVPRLTGDMEFLHLHIPKLMSLLNAKKLRKAERC